MASAFNFGSGIEYLSLHMLTSKYLSSMGQVLRFAPKKILLLPLVYVLQELLSSMARAFKFPKKISFYTDAHFKNCVFDFTKEKIFLSSDAHFKNCGAR